MHTKIFNILNKLQKHFNNKFLFTSVAVGIADQFILNWRVTWAPGKFQDLY